MSDFEVNESLLTDVVATGKTFNEVIKGATTSTPSHANYINYFIQQLLENDMYIKKSVGENVSEELSKLMKEMNSKVMPLCVNVGDKDLNSTQALINDDDTINGKVLAGSLNGDKKNFLLYSFDRKANIPYTIGFRFKIDKRLKSNGLIFEVFVDDVSIGKILNSSLDDSDINAFIYRHITYFPKNKKNPVVIKVILGSGDASDTGDDNMFKLENVYFVPMGMSSLL